MSKIIPKYPRILAIAPVTVGFGFAVFEGQSTLVNWGVKTVKGDKNKGCLLKVQKMIIRYQPDVIVLEDTSAKGSKRGDRIRALTKQIVVLAAKNKVKAVLFSGNEIRKAFSENGEATKQEMAEIVAREFPEELSHQLPPPRRDWESEYSRMSIFDAVGLIMTLRAQQQGEQNTI